MRFCQASVSTDRSRCRLLAFLLAAVFVTLHVPFLASHPGTIDSVNFVLGVQDFDVSDHRPHPPGSPVFMVMGKISKIVLERSPLLPVQESASIEARGLSVLSLLLGALAIFPLLQFFRCLEKNGTAAVAATALTVTCPLFWFTAIRPMSDIPGFAVSLSVQALLVTALCRHHEGNPTYAPVVGSALAAGIAVGVRSQSAWLTVPLLIWVLGCCSTRMRVAGALAFVAGIMVWAVPLVLQSGGPSVYLQVLLAQVGDDFAGVDMLATNPTSDRLRLGLIRTFAFPWADKRLAAAVIGLGIVGAGAMVTRSRRAVVLLAAAVGPYAAFHLAFQESTAPRYALPLVPAAAFLAVRGLIALAPYSYGPLVAGFSVACLVVAVPPVAAYARSGSPASQALREIQSRLARLRDNPLPVIAAHHSVARMVRGEILRSRVLAAVPRHEWLELVKYWRDGGDAPIWFLAESDRSDLALIDPASQRLVRSYRWSFSRKFFVGGPPEAINWYEVQSPGWFAAEGWALTPEVAGVAAADRRGPAYAPIRAFVRRRDEEATLMIGVRLIGQPADWCWLSIVLDGRVLDSEVVRGDPGAFLRMITLRSGLLRGADRYAELRIHGACSDGGDGTSRLLIDQFDVQSRGSIVSGFDQGWYQQEHDPAVAGWWRWTSASATVRVEHAGRNLKLRMAGESAGKYGGTISSVHVRAGSEVLSRFTPAQDFDLVVEVPIAVLEHAGGLITVETDRTFIPDFVLRNGDRRVLGLKIREVSVYADP